MVKRHRLLARLLTRRLLAWLLVAGAVSVLPPGRCLSAGDASAPREDIPTLTYDVVKVWPHDRTAFTQGLVYFDGSLIEGTGLYGHSTLRKVVLETGFVRQEVKLPDQYFGEGIAVLGGKIYQLTWQSHKGFIYDLKSLRLEGEFPFDGEGWGLTTDGRYLIMSDGTNRLRFLDPNTFTVKRTIEVFAHGQPVRMLNALEYVQGQIYANVWQTKFVLQIDPGTGKVLGSIDFVGLLPQSDYEQGTDVMNGIAYDARDDRLFVTGKDWPKLFEIKLKAK